MYVQSKGLYGGGGGGQQPQTTFFASSRVQEKMAFGIEFSCLGSSAFIFHFLKKEVSSPHDFENVLESIYLGGGGGRRDSSSA